MASSAIVAMMYAVDILHYTIIEGGWDFGKANYINYDKHL